MTSVDELFKRPAIPSQKRKLEAPKDPNELYKSVKLSQNGDVRTSLPATTADEEEDDDTAAGPELPPDLEDPSSDEEGRFFGGGVDKDTRQMMDFVDLRDQDEGVQKAEKIDAGWLRKTALSFEKKISKNAELRAKFGDQPQRFMASEADLDESVKALSILSEHPELYPEFARLGCLASLVSLLSHENTDIAIDAMQIIDELTDEDVSATQDQWETLVSALLDADLLSILHSNLSRLNEGLESDRTGVYHTLGILESLASHPSHAGTISTHPSFLPWLLARSLAPEKTTSQNKQYAAEILAILLQSSPAASIPRFLSLSGPDAYLQALAPYRKRDPPRGTEEEEFVENLFAGLTLCLSTSGGKAAFLEAEGVELCLIMVRAGKLARPRALRLLDHCLGGSGSGSGSSATEGAVTAACTRLVDAAGLKPLFAAFMHRATDRGATEHILGILASMFRRLPPESAPRIRLLGKFVEKGYEKIARLVAVRREVAARVRRVEGEIEAERKEWEREREREREREKGKEKGMGEDKGREEKEEEREELEAEWTSRRLEAGGFALQSLDLVLAWLVAEDDGARGKIVEELGERDEGLEGVRGTLRGMLEGLGGVEEREREGEGEGESEEESGERREVRDMLETLIGFLQ